MELRLDRLYQESYNHQGEVLVKCQDLLVLCESVSGNIKAISNIGTGNAPVHLDQDCLSIHSEIPSNLLYGRHNSIPNGLPLDLPTKNGACRAAADAKMAYEAGN